MLRSLKTRLQPSRKDEGFTLIELMVVVLIIAILLGIAIPTFLGAQNKAKDRSAQSSLRNTLTAAKTIFADSSDYASATSTELAKVEPSLTFVANTTASSGPKTVSVDYTSPTQFFAAAQSATGQCFYIRDNVGSSGPGTEFNKPASGATCTGGAAKALTTGWNGNGF